MFLVSPNNRSRWRVYRLRKKKNEKRRRRRNFENLFPVSGEWRARRDYSRISCELFCDFRKVVSLIQMTYITTVKRIDRTAIEKRKSGVRIKREDYSSTIRGLISIRIWCVLHNNNKAAAVYEGIKVISLSLSLCQSFYVVE